mmetsp:Transcript_10777/g.33223  ORF Transcript_10777/g.33223 Transcript_10777/m.33223 type:complete len:355 (+) Transcript_10777:156-1220(+)
MSLLDLPLRSTLPSNTSWHVLRGALDDVPTRTLIWTLWASLSSIALVLSATLLVAILASRTVRARPLNLYLCALLVPDLLFNLNFSFVASFSAARGAYASEAACYFQSIFIVFGCSGSLYMNAVLALEVFRLLLNTKELRDHIEPSRREVLSKVLCVYAWCAFLSTLQLWGFDFHKPFPFNGLFCAPLVSSTEGLLFSWLVIVPLAFATPIVVVVALVLTSWRRQLFTFGTQLHTVSSGFQPRTKSDSDIHRKRIRRARAITVFFTRIFIALALWTPGFISTVVYVPSSAVLAMCICWGFVQTYVTVALCLSKPDVRGAMVDLVTCRRGSSTGVYPRGMGLSRESSSGWGPNGA